MFDTARRIGLLAAYQLAVVLGIVLMPVALFARTLGVRLPVGDLVATLGEAYDRAAE